MAFKGASESEATQRAVKRAADEGVKPAPWAIVAFRVGRDNMGRERVYRRIWTFRDKNKAAQAYSAPALLGTYGHVVLCEGSCVLADGGDRVLVARWTATRKGVNAGCDPYTAAGHIYRELHPGATYGEEGRDLRHLAKERLR